MLIALLLVVAIAETGTVMFRPLLLHRLLLAGAGGFASAI